MWVWTGCGLRLRASPFIIHPYARCTKGTRIGGLFISKFVMETRLDVINNYNIFIKLFSNYRNNTYSFIYYIFSCPSVEWRQLQFYPSLRQAWMNVVDFVREYGKNNYNLYLNQLQGVIKWTKELVDIISLSMNW